MDEAAVNPVPGKRRGGRLVLTDGHEGLRSRSSWDRTIPADWETDKLGRESYRIRVDGCLKAGIASIVDLEGRVISAKRYVELF